MKNQEKDQLGPVIRAIARRLLAHAPEGSEKPDSVGSILRVYASARSRLSQFLGPAGFDALMSRSLAISAAKHPEFARLRMDSEGRVLGLREYTEGRPAKEVMEGLEELVSQLIYLISSFIGLELTERLIGDAPPINSEDYYHAISREAQ